MTDKTTKWAPEHYGSAMLAAVTKYANSNNISLIGDKVLFNGFWRDGDKQNCCIWPYKGTFADAKTGEGGGAKGFAKIALNMNLKDFMDEFGSVSNLEQPIKKNGFSSPIKPVSVNTFLSPWKEMALIKIGDNNAAANWLKARGIHIEKNIKLLSGMLNSSGMKEMPNDCQSFLRSLKAKGEFLLSPISNVINKRIVNFALRPLFASQGPKTLFLPKYRVAKEVDESPNGFGIAAHLTKNADLVLCEGLTDTLFAESTVNREESHVAVMGANSASGFRAWGKWLAENHKGNVIIVYHLDREKGGLSPNATGQKYALAAMKEIKKFRNNAYLFPWRYFLKTLKANGLNEPFSKTKDLNDVGILARKQNFNFHTLQKIFEESWRNHGIN